MSEQQLNSNLLHILKNEYSFYHAYRSFGSRYRYPLIRYKNEVLPVSEDFESGEPWNFL